MTKRTDKWTEIETRQKATKLGFGCFTWILFANQNSHNGLKWIIIKSAT